MQKVTRIVAILLVLLALALAVAAITVGKRATTPAAAPAATAQAPRVPVVVAARELEAGAVIPGDALQVVEQAQRPVGGYSRIDQVAGRVPAQRIAAGATLTSSVIAQGLGLQLNPGERAIAVPVDELAGAGNRIAPGDYVDVFLNLGGGRAGSNEQPGQTRLLLSRLRVLGYGGDDLDRRNTAQAQSEQAATEGTTEETTAPRDGSRAAGIARRNGDSDANARAGAAGAARSAVLAVPVEHANSLLLGAQSGKLFLALRHPGDTGLADASLFPEPRKVLSPRANLGAEDRLALERAENEAFAGIDNVALSGQGAAARPAAPVRSAGSGSAPRNTGIEIIRGDGRGTRPSTL